MTDEIQYFLSPDGLEFDAFYRGRNIGQITFVRVGIDKMIIDYTGVDKPFQRQQVGLNLVRNVANLARSQHRKIIAICPFARAMFNRYPEFDDIRLMNAH
ncbi:MAG: N-acetyltransferase [Alphaproteobacteria bacterium]|nr:N-acetyltransferase [Alphaproteobacteria bacterium]